MLDENTVTGEGCSIALDYTLYDLYSLDSDGAPLPVQVFHDRQAHNYGLPSAKLLYHTGFHVGDVAMDTSKKLSTKTIPQRYGFLAGKMNVVIFGLDPSPEHNTISADHANVYRTFSQLRYSQQPIVSIVTDPNQLQLTPGTHIAVTLPIDRLSHLPHVVDQEKHYEMLSKRVLARSGLCTPPSTVIDTLLRPEEVHDDMKLQREIARVVKLLDMRRLPFMVKLNQSLGGFGATSVSCEEDRNRAKALVSAYLRKVLPQINAVNQHLHPCSLVLQDFVAGPAVGFSMFVTRKGRAIFVACVQQHFNNEGYWAGASVSYSDQEDLRQRYAKPMEEVAKFLHQNGYYGPAGIDIMTDAATQYIVDINARITGSYHLGPLMGHFTQRGMGQATAIKDHFLLPRAMFEKTFAREIREGSLIVTGWARNESLSLSQVAVTAGGRDALEVESLIARIRAHSVSISALMKQLLNPVIATDTMANPGLTTPRAAPVTTSV